MSWFGIDIVFLTGTIVLFLSHELGHYFLAKIEGNYYSWGLLPNPHVKLSKPYKSRWGYLSGIPLSIVSLPFFVVDGFGLFVSVLLIFAIAGFDYIPFIFYNKIDFKDDWVKDFKKKEKKFPLFYKYHIL